MSYGIKLLVTGDFACFTRPEMKVRIVRKTLEEKSGNKISTPENHQTLTDSKKRISRKKSDF